MEKKKVVSKLEDVIESIGIAEQIDRTPKAIAEYLYKQLDALMWLSTQPQMPILPIADGSFPLFEACTPISKSGDNALIDEFVDKMYALYPTKCPKRNTSLGKSRKDKVKIKRLLKTYSQEEIERVIRHEVDSNYGVNYMKNFSTFLNNFPDPNEGYTTEPTASSGQASDKIIIGGIEYK